MSVEVRNLVKIYGAQKAVNNISFKLNKGEIVGFLGPNGAGKSTTMKIITGYLHPTSGDAFVSGTNVAEDPLRTKSRVGYLPEANPLYYDMYIREYLAFIAEVHRVKNQRSRMDEVVRLTGLTLESKKKIGQLSKGYKQRVGLAAALLHDPEVLILDEPTSGLDPNQIIEIRDVIKQQGREKTVLFSSHILQEVEAICDRVIIIHKGVIVADDKLVNLQKAGGDEHTVKVVFEEIIDKTWIENIDDVSRLEQLPPSGFRLQTSKPEKVRKQILEISLQNNLNIVSLQSENQSLEEVFRSLTQPTEQLS